METTFETYFDQLDTLNEDKTKKTTKGFFSLQKPKLSKKKGKYLLVVISGNIVFQKNIKSNLNFYDNLNYYNFFIPLIKELSKIYPDELLVRFPKSQQQPLQRIAR